jgi:SAM-dependent methyltransferase
LTSREDWSRFEVAAIPTKTDLGELEAWLDLAPPPARILDLGCGVGAVSRRLSEKGFSVVGVEINSAAVEEARRTASGATFHVRDVTSPRGLELDEVPFDRVVCQLVLSIVGDLSDRRRLLENAYDSLRPGGLLYLSASGASDELNPSYARLYERDFPSTGERHTYYSRDEGGNVLYRTHHFTEEELHDLLEGAGFVDVAIRRKEETSSRRPGEAAYFLYAFAKRELGRNRPL